MEDRKKLFIIITTILTAVAIGLISASFALDNWVKATAEKRNETSYNSTNQPFAEITFGLFKGKREINYGNGIRPQDITVVCGIKYCLLYNKSLEHFTHQTAFDEAVGLFNNATDQSSMYNYGLFPTSLWATTIAMASIGIVWGLIYMGFAIFNIFGKPIETITGPMGLYLWNGLALLFSLISVIVYLVLFFEYHSNSVMPRSDILQGFTSTAHLDFAFYMLVASVCIFAVNIGMLALSGTRLQCAFTREAEKVMDGGMILY